MTTIAVIGTLDTKGAEHAFLADVIRNAGHEVLLVDIGTARPPTVAPDITRQQILSAAVDGSIALQQDRGAATRTMSEALPLFMQQLYADRRIDGVIALGGSCGTAIATAGMRALPIGFPKVMVSTMASGNVAHYIDVSDIVMMPAIVDVSGLNRVSRGVFERAAAVVIALATANQRSLTASSSDAKPIVVASMFGNTTRCVEQARVLLEQAGYEVLVFHATGAGGRAMEAIIDSGMVDGVLDVTTTEWADELVGGVLTAGPQRLEAAARRGVPAVIAPGCLDMVNFGEPSTIADKFRGRRFYAHNPQVTLMRTTPDECRQLGTIIAAKLNQSVGPIRVMFPLKAISVISAAGQPFHDAEADRALKQSWKESLRSDIPFEEIDCEINDLEFATDCVERLLSMMRIRH